LTKGRTIRYMTVKERRVMTRPRTLSLVFFAILSLILIGDAAVFSFIQAVDTWTMLLGAVAMLMALLSSMVLFLLPFEEGFSRAGGSLAVVASVTLVAFALPSFGNSYVDAAILCLIVLVVVTIHQDQFYEPRKGAVPREIVLPIVLLLPVFLAIVESAVLGGGIWSEFHQAPPLYFIPFAALFGYFEEAVFRGGVQREIGAVAGPNRALVCGAALDAGFMAFWGSYPLVVFTFVVALLMGFIYKKWGSVTLVGVTRAIEASWLMIILAMLA
jgi:hypothetical protein